MADRRRAGRKSAKEDQSSSDELSKANESMAKFVRFNCPTKVGMFEGNEVHYFSGRKGIDTLVESKKYGSAAADPKFATRAQAETFLTSLLRGGLFFRAKILVPKKKEDPRRPKREQVSESPRVKRVKQTEEPDTNNESGTDTKKEDPEAKKEEEKKKKKIKLIVHDQQVYNDDTDVYVWIFDPTPLHKKIIGLLIVLGVILACLFPLWPDWLRLGVYYLSVTGISLFGLLLGVALLRTILFGVIYLTTMGRHNLWILPNLTEDCGFFESFHPLYTYEYCAPSEDGKKKDKKKKKDTEEEPLIEDVEEPATSSKSPKQGKSKKPAKESAPPPDPVVEKPQEETDPEEKYSKSGSEEENSSAEEDEVSEDENQGGSNNESTGDSSEPADVVRLEKDVQAKEEEKEESQTTPNDSKSNKTRRRRVRRADEEDFVMIQNDS